MPLPVALNRPDWVLLRQALAYSLARVKPVALKGGADFLNSNERFQPVFNDIRAACERLRAGALETVAGDIVFTPSKPLTGTFALETGRFSSTVELLLFFLPALFNGDFRTVLTIKGVTHSPHSYSTGFIKETLYPVLEECGLYASLELRRFGFYGSGGGMIEARAYPSEERKPRRTVFSGVRSIEGARIFAAGVSMELARKEALLVREALGLVEGRVSIIEIRDADGMGNTVQVYVRCGDDMLLLQREMELYDCNGDFIYDEDSFNAAMQGLFDEARARLQGGVPTAVMREMLAFTDTRDFFGQVMSTGHQEIIAETARVFSLINGN